MFLTIALSAVIAQSDATPKASVPADQSAAERAAAAAEKAAAAAQLAAEAAMRIAQSVAPSPPTLVITDKKKLDAWIGSVGLGLTFITGNAQSLTLTGNGSADRKWEKWALGIRLIGAYGLTNPDPNQTSVTSVTALRGAGTVRMDRTLGQTFAAIYALVGAETDHVKNIESRTVGELGAGLTFFDTKQGDLEKFYLRIDLAMRSGFETRFQYYPVPNAVANYGIALLAPRAAVTLRWNFTKDVRLVEELEFIPYLLEPSAGRLLINNNTRFLAGLTENLALATGFLLNFDSQPPLGADGLPRKTTDIALTVGLEAKF